MPIVSAEQFKSSLKARAKLLGLDVSKSVIGVAFGDTATGIVTPVKIIKRTRLKDDAATLLKLIGEYEAAGLVIGWPLNMDGTEGVRCQAVKDTMLEMSKSFQAVKITFHDERRTTDDAYNMVEEVAGKSFKSKRKAVDSHAAMLILQSFLDQP